MGTFLGFTAVIAPVYAAASCLAWVSAYAVVRVSFIGLLFMIAVLGFGISHRYDWTARERRTPVRQCSVLPFVGGCGDAYCHAVAGTRPAATGALTIPTPTNLSHTR